MVLIRKYEEKDKEEIWQIIEYVISKGNSFTFALDTPREFALEDWCSSDKETFVALDEDGKVVGTFYIKANQVGLGSHVAYGNYMVSPEARRQGIGRKWANVPLKKRRN